MEMEQEAHDAHQDQPALEPSHELRRIDESAVWVWRLSAFLWLPAYLAPMYVVVFRWSSWASPWLMLAASAVLVTAFVYVVAWWVPKLRWKYWRYQLGEHHVLLRYGFLIIREVVIPFARVQLVDTSHGPIMRSYGLMNVSISTAGGDHSIPALPEDEAARLRNYIADQARLHDVDV